MPAPRERPQTSHTRDVDDISAPFNDSWQGFLHQDEGARRLISSIASQAGKEVFSMVPEEI